MFSSGQTQLRDMIDDIGQLPDANVYKFSLLCSQEGFVAFDVNGDIGWVVRNNHGSPLGCLLRIILEYSNATVDDAGIPRDTNLQTDRNFLFWKIRSEKVNLPNQSSLSAAFPRFEISQ